MKLMMIILTLNLFQNLWANEGLLVSEFGETRITKSEVLNFIVNSKMTDEKKIELFKNSKNFDEYLKRRKDWLEKHLSSNILELTYYKMLEHHAVKLNNFNGKRLAFNTTESDYYDLVEKKEDEALSKLLEKQLGIVKSRKIFGQFLIDQDYPHKFNESAEDVYFRWYDSLKKRAKEEIRKQEVKKYEQVMALDGKTPEANSTEIMRLNQKITKQLENEIYSKAMTFEQLQKKIKNSPELGVLIKKATPESLVTSPLKVVRKYPQSSSVEYELRTFSYKLNKNLIERILSYEKIVHKIAGKYQTKSKLKELRKKAEQEYKWGSGSYSDLMMSYVYDAALSLEEKTQRIVLRNNLVSVLKNLFQRIRQNPLESLKDEELSSARNLKNFIHNQLKLDNSEYFKKLKSMISWLITHEYKTNRSQNHGFASIELYEYPSQQAYKRLKQFIKHKKFKEGLKNFKDIQLRSSFNNFLLLLAPGEIYTGEAAWNKLLTN